MLIFPLYSPCSYLFLREIRLGLSLPDALRVDFANVQPDGGGDLGGVLGLVVAGELGLGGLLKKKRVSNEKWLYHLP